MNCLIVLSSVTYAMKAQKLLSQYRIYSTLTKSSSVRMVKGCGYGLKLNGNCAQAQRILEENNIRVLGVVEDGIV